MGLIVLLLAGAFIGWIASKIMGTDQSMGAVANIVAGLVGAVIGRFVSGLLLNERFGTEFSLPGLLFGILGACILIGIVKAITGRGRPAVH
ncbi:MAG TPA: GlsB/YeaQ/YmgE family stress response membrane protein [Abditibacteriaceae bacterium]|nr:GlsB/YeaQ/YmgE family stress response membrane protein [Abditibacteriaceae bacterium]